MRIEAVLQRLLQAPPTPRPIDDLATWWAHHLEVTRDAVIPVHRAMLAGFSVDRPGYAFASGYQEALRCLLGATAPQIATAKLALCATEPGGAHPSSIQTRLEPDGDGLVLTGLKTYATLASHADGYLVFASEGRDAGGLNRLAAVRVPAGRAGVRVEEISGKELPLVPEIPHARVHFDRVRIWPGERLPGDGYETYLKPFRTVEDCHVYAAVLAWLLQVGRGASWPEGVLEGLVLGLTSMAAIATSDLKHPATHLALTSLLAQSDRLLRENDACWETV
ncbi:MAG TPA: acyl-CoA dehydrogenase family protein, partial [Haliangium sp.]|nr:acyl-CoA dehydrogenase family protein [Haliangium sp.]